MDIEKDLQNLESMPFSEIRATLTENMFHIVVWNMMNLSQRVRLLQMLENNLACRDGRTPSEIEVIPKLRSLASASKLTNKIRISQWHLTFGFNGLDNLNAQIYCAVCHEHEHFNQFIDAESEKSDKKTEECRINLKFIFPYSGASVQDYIDYRLQPIEYYAHKLSEEQTISTFKRLEKKFGEDKGYREWYDVVSLGSVESLIQIYNSEYFTTCNFDELYASIINKIVDYVKKSTL